MCVSDRYALMVNTMKVNSHNMVILDNVKYHDFLCSVQEEAVMVKILSRFFPPPKIKILRKATGGSLSLLCSYSAFFRMLLALFTSRSRFSSSIAMIIKE